ncbi:hypothetical protein [Cryobacterium sp. TMT2-42-4]|uniref:hypothetical protein n=1 Tax=Cryobacterium sp. TMT2-42-4 TaxID=1259255 RepID=UPI00106A27A0|nr:hypothetical protein [Cryobacterium sp. TMT2-42-4]TFC34128.1 hypothetical protein E3O18_12620 [Cryobacterium sp. TMT2-42-4]
MKQQFSVNRQGFGGQPLLSHLDVVHSQELEAQYGGQYEWFWGVPGVFQALAAPLTGQMVPAAPETNDPHEQRLGYWGALHYLLLHRLGWARPDRGLRWWYDQGKPAQDPTMALILAVWDADGHVDAYLAWLLKGQPVFLAPESQPWAEWPTEREPLPDRWVRWAADIERAGELSESKYFLGGWDPLHLSGHTGEGGEPDPASTLTVTSRTERRAVFVTDTMNAWHYDLAKKASKLPEGNKPPWRVDVFVRPVGFLGTYRKSYQTGLWFTGRHSYHAAGN